MAKQSFRAVRKGHLGAGPRARSRTGDRSPAERRSNHRSASRLCFYALASGAKAVWRSNAPPPYSGGANEFLTTNALNLEPALADATLDTALFRGEGHIFEAFHRTVAEFLAARFLARIVTGAGSIRRSHCGAQSRSLPALIEGTKRTSWIICLVRSPSSRQGDAQGALRLIDRDAATVLAYGDAAAFDTSDEKQLF